MTGLKNTLASFNPRSREGNDTDDENTCAGITVSIHVPAKGTTPFIAYPGGRFVVSIHVPAKGTTGRGTKIFAIKFVSIHVPAKGTTSPTAAHTRSITAFQSTFPRRERLPDCV